MEIMFFIVAGGDLCLRLANVVVELLLTTDGDLYLGGIIRGLGENLYVGQET
jgi:hypothetical protein